MAKNTVKSNFNVAAKNMKKYQTSIEESCIIANTEMGIGIFKTVEDKFIETDPYLDDGRYTSPPNADIPKKIVSKGGKESLSKKMVFIKNMIVTRTGGLLDSVKSLISAINGKGIYTTNDYEARIGKTKLTILATSPKAVVLEKKRTPKSSARKPVLKSARKVLNYWKKSWQKAFKK